MAITKICLITLCTGALISDLKTYKIPNAWILIFLMAGVVFGFSGASSISFGDRLLGLIIPIILLGWLFYFRMMGAADIKLLAVIGFWIGKDCIWRFLLYSFVFAAIIAFIKMIRQRNLFERFQNLSRYIKSLFLFREKMPYMGEDDKKSRVRMSVPIFGAVLLYLADIL